MKRYCPQHRYNPLRRRRLAWQTLAVLVAAVATSVVAADSQIADVDPAQKLEQCDRPLDTLWLISTRHLCCPEECPVEYVDLQVEQCQGDDGWEESNLEALIQASRDTMIVIYIPGNRADWDTAILEGKDARDALTACCPPQPITFVIWSWPSDRIRGLLQDFRVKAARADCDGVYLAWFLARLDEHNAGDESKISLVGYSYGVRIAIGALHAWNGGSLAGVHLPDADVQSDTRVRLVLVAAAEHNYWLQPDSMHGMAYGRIDYALNVYNSCDRALKRYRVVQRRSRPNALGYTGLAGRSCFADYAERIHEYDACCHIGKTHEIANYWQDVFLTDKITRYALWDAVDW